MSCMKCGKVVSEEQVFCDECLAEMEHYPVKPGTPVMLPYREPMVVQRKRRSAKRIRKPEEQLAVLRRTIRLLYVVLCLLLVFTTISILLNLKLLDGDLTKVIPALLR